jgi:hypothetical protein
MLMLTPLHHPPPQKIVLIFAELLGAKQYTNFYGDDVTSKSIQYSSLKLLV